MTQMMIMTGGKKDVYNDEGIALVNVDEDEI